MESAINGTQLEVKFNTTVDKTDVETNAATLFKVAGTGAASAKLSADSKTAVVTFAASIESDAAVLVVEPIKVNAEKKTATFTKVLSFKDTVKPTVTKVESATNTASANAVVVTFSEPVKSGADAPTFKVNGSAVATANVSIATDGLTATLTGLNLDQTKEHKLEVLNIKDKATTVNVTSLETKSFTVVKDTTAPTVTLSPLSDSQVLITFSKKMNATTVNTTNIKFKDETLADLTLSSLTAQTGDTTGTKFIATLPAGLYADKSARNLTVFQNGDVADAVGNKIPTGTQSISISKDTAKPVVQSVSFTKNSSGVVDKVIVEFNEILAASAGYTTTGINVVGPDGRTVSGFFTGTTSAAVAAGSKIVEIPVDTTKNIKGGSYTLYFPGAFVTDNAQTANNSVATSKVLAFGTTANEFKIEQSAISQTPSNTTNVITVNYGTAVKGGVQAGSATDTENYRLNGEKLPEGTVITLSADYTTATITLPNETVAKTDTAAVLQINNVQNAAGVTITTFAGTTSVTDSISPTLKAASVNANGTATLEISESLTTALVKGDLDVVVNNKVLDATSFEIASAIGADAGKYVITVTATKSDNGTAGDATDDFMFLNVAATGATAGYDAAIDIKLTGVAVSTDPTATLNLGIAEISSLVVKTKATGTLTGADRATNKIKNASEVKAK